ncbi:MAG: PqqD family protein [Candidatus Omnitrophota bacterium]
MLVPIYRHSDEINCIYTLNDSAVFVWHLIDGKKSLVDIKKRLLKEFTGSDAKITQKLGKLMIDLKEAGAIIC